MTAPARANGVPSTPGTPRERALRSVPGRSRSAAAERAYARREQRTRSSRGTAVTRQPVAAPKAPFVVMVMVVLGVGIAAIMWLSTQATADSYRLQDARAEEKRLARQVEQLRQEVALAESPRQLAEAAARLGLVPVEDPARLRQLPDGTVEVYGKPSEAKAPTPPPTSTPPTSTPPAQPDPNAQQPPADPNAQQPPAQTDPNAQQPPPAQTDPNAQQPPTQQVPGGQ
ncbi:hypothetical protein [Saccharothrix variisporea]|uniref:Cell division protein FtsB n=1 Tax=Saccharothrix variisporea TaxID=543527 RepID=A0A495XNH3_9PSEU|nr:hypothetical protein [Saccharothrix variisporea]RKT73198.1 hypothetical protein DFJ66_6527 [Saccharothrix variisporea]